CWYVDSRHAGARHVPAFAVDAVDTTGCGDVFHGVYAAMLARGIALDARIRIASAAAAMKARLPGGQDGCPTLDQLRTFLQAAAPEAACVL
ncbi:MAG: PfkB family carbohydrate kinase, partial [Patescibacteria group bacterium]|nr:PfkB family carbohydrate kinase [Patescibacteria group bacterium]